MMFGGMTTHPGGCSIARGMTGSKWLVCGAVCLRKRAKTLDSRCYADPKVLAPAKLVRARRGGVAAATQSVCGRHESKCGNG